MRKALLAILILAMLAPMALADDHTFDEQKVIFNMERQMCTVLRNLSAALGVAQSRIQDCRAEGHSADLPHRWIYGWRPHRHSDRYKSWFEITAIYYVDGESKVIKTQTSQPDVVEGEGWSNIYTAGEVPIDQEVTVTMELQEEKSSSYDVGVSFSITNRTSAKASGGVPGVGDAEVSTETEVTASSSFGLNSAKSSAETETYSETTTIHIPANTQYRVTADKVRYTEIKTVQETAQVDFEFKWKLYHFACNHDTKYLCDGESYEPLYFDNRQDFCDFLEGEHPREHPRMDHFLRDVRDGKTHWAKTTWNAYQYMCVHDDNWQVSLWRTDKREYENVTQIRTEKVD